MSTGANSRDGFAVLGFRRSAGRATCSVLPSGNARVRICVRVCCCGCWRVRICAGGLSATTSSHTGAIGIRFACSSASARRRTRSAVRFMRPMGGGSLFWRVLSIEDVLGYLVECRV